MIRGYFSTKKFRAACIKHDGYCYEDKYHETWHIICDGLPVSENGFMQTSEGFTYSSHPDFETQEPPKEMPK